MKIDWFARVAGTTDERVVPLVGDSSLKEITLRRFDSLDEQDYQKAYCFHEFCYSVWAKKLGGSLTSRNLIQLARSLEDSSLDWENRFEDGNWTEEYSSISTVSLLSGLEGSFVDQKSSFLSKLPMEIRSIVWEQCYYGHKLPWFPYRAMIVVSNEASRLARQLQGSRSTFTTFGPGASLSVELMSIYGSVYIKRLCRHIGTLDSPANAVTIPGPVAAVKFARGTHGIRAIKFIGETWESEWLGKVSKNAGVWYGTIVGPAGRLECRYNVSRLLTEKCPCSHLLEPMLGRVLQSKHVFQSHTLGSPRRSSIP